MTHQEDRSSRVPDLADPGFAALAEVAIAHAECLVDDPVQKRLFAGLIAYPLIRGVILSFYNYTGITNRGFVGLQNYERLWENRQFRSSVWITVQYATIAVFLVRHERSA